jgi:hypothetical protein
LKQHQVLVYLYFNDPNKVFILLSDQQNFIFGQIEPSLLRLPMIECGGSHQIGHADGREGGTIGQIYGQK